MVVQRRLHCSLPAQYTFNYCWLQHKVDISHWLVDLCLPILLWAACRWRWTCSSGVDILTTPLKIQICQPRLAHIKKIWKPEIIIKFNIWQGKEGNSRKLWMLQKLVGICSSYSLWLLVSGYTTQVLGIHHHCRFRDLHQPGLELCCTASVIPSLPLLEVSTSLLRSHGGFSSMADSECVVSSAALTVYAGQRFISFCCHLN